MSSTTLKNQVQILEQRLHLFKDQELFTEKLADEILLVIARMFGGESEEAIRIKNIKQNLSNILKSKMDNRRVNDGLRSAREELFNEYETIIKRLKLKAEMEEARESSISPEPTHTQLQPTIEKKRWWNKISFGDVLALIGLQITILGIAYYVGRNSLENKFDADKNNMSRQIYYLERDTTRNGEKIRRLEEQLKKLKKDTILNH